jgi:hypothetical protein
MATMSRAALCGLLALLALAGCIGPDAAPAPAAPAQTASPIPSELHLSKCEGWQSGSLPFPRSVGPGQGPPEWAPTDPALPTSSVLMVGYRCERISLGPFERGPLHLVLDVHDHADIPQACRDGSPTGAVAFVLSSLWVDDAEVAAVLNQTHGMPARLAEVQATQAGATAVRTWTWGPKGQPPSTLTFADGGDRQPTVPSNLLLLWQRGAGIGGLALFAQREATRVEPPAYGTLQPPMVLASLPLGAFAGTVKPVTTPAIDGSFHAFRDHACSGEA